MARTIDTPLHTGDQSIDRLLAAGLPVALVFYSGSLEKGLEQTLVRSAAEIAGKALIARVDVKDNPVSAGRYRVGGLPALVTLRDGQEATRVEQVGPREFEQHLAYLLGQGPQPRAPQKLAHEGHPQAVTDASFDKEVMQSTLPVLVDFWAPWCGPCRMTEPVVEKLANELAGSLKVAKVNVDENPRLSGRLGIQSIPTMLVVKNGQVVDRWVGALPEQAVRSRLRAVTG